MKKKITEILKSLGDAILNEENVKSSVVISHLDEIAAELNLQTIYVCESTGTKNHFMYPFVTTGPLSPIMYYNLIVMQDDDISKFIELFKDKGINVFDGQISASRRGAAKGNLAYGYIEGDSCLGFVSFQPKEGDEHREWTIEEKEIIKRLALIIKPIITKRQLHDKIAYQKNISRITAGVFWYYPKLKLVIVPEDAMNKFSIQNLVFRNAPVSFTDEFVCEDDREAVNQSFLSICKDNKSSFVTFYSTKKDNSYHLSLTVNRVDDNELPIEVMGVLEKISKEQKEFEEKNEILKQYEHFKTVISNDNIAECYVNLLTGKMTVFKAEDKLKEILMFSNDFDECLNNVSDKFVCKESRESFVKTLNSESLREKLNEYNHTITITSNFDFGGKVRRLETTVVLNTTSIYNYVKDVMVFVRDVTLTESLNYDKLTGLLTTSHFISRMKEEKARLIETKSKARGSVIYFDIYQFRLFNLQFGVSAGNEALKSIASILSEVYENSQIGRFNDDHFVVLDLSENSETNAVEKVQKVIDEASTIFKDVKIKIKAGIYHLDLGIDPENAIDCAMLACQDIKKNTLDFYRVYDESFRAKSDKKEYIVSHIDDAIANNWIKAYYQPVVSTNDFTMVAMEALARWDDPVYGFLYPNEFISALEENNLIYKLDIYMLDQIGQRIRKEMDSGNKIVPISFNLSKNDFLNCSPFDETEKVVKKYNIERKYICVEITESVTMNEPSLISNVVNQFRDAGYEVWMDDFGVGYSSLNVLKDFTFDEIKIDMSFLRTFNEKTKTIISYIIAMAKLLNIRTLTEGVETKEHVAFLTEVGCERIQGYYFSKPLPYEELMKTLEEKKISIS